MELKKRKIKILAWLCVALTFSIISVLTNQPTVGAFATGIGVTGWIFIYHVIKYLFERKNEAGYAE